MVTTACPSADVLRDFVLGRLTGAVVLSLEAHLQQCASCAASLDRIDGVDDLVADMRRVGGTRLPRNAMLEQLRVKMRGLRPPLASQVRTFDSPDITAQPGELPAATCVSASPVGPPLSVT